MKVREIFDEIRGIPRPALTIVSAAFAAAVVALLATVATRAQPTLGSPFATITTGITTGAAVQVIGTNPTRRSISICSTSGNVNAAPSPITPTTGTTGVGIQISANNCFTPPANLFASGNAVPSGNSWSAIGQTGTANVIVLEW